VTADQHEQPGGILDAAGDRAAEAFRLTCDQAADTGFPGGRGPVMTSTARCELSKAIRAARARRETL
jgi:hypothetical protein